MERDARRSIFNFSPEQSPGKSRQIKNTCYLLLCNGYLGNWLSISKVMKNTAAPREPACFYLRKNDDEILTKSIHS